MALLADVSPLAELADDELVAHFHDGDNDALNVLLERYRLGEWPSDLKVFNPSGAVALYDKLPASETPKTYPSPAGSSGSGSSSSTAAN